MRPCRVLPVLLALAASACSSAAQRIDPGISAPTAGDKSNAEWQFEPLRWSAPSSQSTLQGITILDVGERQLALGVDDAAGTQRLIVWHTDDAVAWNWSEVPSTDGEATVQARAVMATAVDGDVVAAVGIANRLIDPHHADGSGIHADPSDVVGGVWWSSNGGTTWQHTSTTEAAQFTSVAIIDGDIWVGGSLGSNSTLQPAVWRVHDGTLSQQGVFGEPSFFGMVSKITKEREAIIVDVMAEDYSAERQQRTAAGWRPTGESVQAENYYESIALSPGTTFATNNQILHDGPLEVRQGSYLQRADLAYCFVDATTCKTDASGFVIRRAGGPWELLDAPDLGYTWTAPAPQIRDHKLVVYSATPGGPPTQRATLDLTGNVATVAYPTPPDLPAPPFDGTLEVDQPEAVEIGVGCGAEQLTINGTLMGPVSLTDGGMPADAPIRRHGFGSDGPQFAVYGLLVLRADGTVEVTNAAGKRLTTYEPTAPPEFFCG